MTRDLTTRPNAGRAVAAASPPPMTPWLRQAVKDRLIPHPDVKPEPLKPGVQAEAMRAADALEATLQPASPEQWEAWLKPFVAMLANAPNSAAALRGNAVAMASALNDIPASALTTDAQREVLRTQRFWPTPADLWGVLKGTWQERRAELSALRRIAEEKPAEDAKEAMTPEQRAQMAAQMRALSAELIAGGPDADKPKDKPRHIQGAQLIASYERQIELASEQARGPLEFRLKVLRRQMEAAR